MFIRSNSFSYYERRVCYCKIQPLLKQPQFLLVVLPFFQDRNYPSLKALLIYSVLPSLILINYSNITNIMRAFYVISEATELINRKLKIENGDFNESKVSMNTSILPICLPVE